MADPEDRFLARWSRRKRATRRDRSERRESDAAPPAPEAPTGLSAEAAESEVVAQLPDIDSLDDSSDFSVFLKQGVPDLIRRKALRKLWRINPVLANLDGLNDYDEDFSKLGMVAGTLKTAYKVGKGYLDEDEVAADEVAADEVAADEGAADEVAEMEGAEGNAGPAADPSAEDEPVQIAERSQAALRPESEADPKADGSAESLAAATGEFRNSVRGSAWKRRWGAFAS